SVERKRVPRLKSDDFVILDLQLNAALLATKAAVRFDKSVGFYAAIKPRAGGVCQMGTKLFDDFECGFRLLCHVGPSKVFLASVPWRFACSGDRCAGSDRPDRDSSRIDTPTRVRLGLSRRPASAMRSPHGSART